MPTNNEINSLIEKPMSSDSIEKYMRGGKLHANIVTMESITKYNNLSDVFKGNNHAILFTATNTINSGHWQCIFLDDNNLYFFDSYGMKPFELINKVNLTIKDNDYGQNNNLSKLIHESRYFPNNCFMNTFEYQEKGSNVDTCGRHVVSCLISKDICNKRSIHFDLNVYNVMVTELMKENKFKNYDETVSFIVEN